MSNFGIVDLHDDGFEGSNDEFHISQQVFYGNDVDICSKSCIATRLAGRASEENQILEISLCSNSVNSAVINQASSKDCCQKDADTMDFQRHFGVQGSTEWSVVGARIEHNLNAKRVKLSVNELSNFKPYLDTALTSSMQMKQVISGMCDPAWHPCQILMCHVVESSGEDVRSSCFLLKQYPESDREANLIDGSTPNVSLSGSEGSVIKQFGGSKSTASPISEESSATKLLVCIPSALMVNEPGLCKHAERRPKRDISLEPEDDVLLTSDSRKDSRALLRSRVFHLLKTAGWSMEKWKRGSGRYRYMYRSPGGKLFREIRRVWDLLGQSVSAHCNYQAAGEDKHWTDVGHFWSDLYDTLRYIENEMDNWEPKLALTHQWSLLNPFVTVVLIDRKLHALRAGNLGKAKQSDVGYVSSKSEVKFRLKYKDRDGNGLIALDRHQTVEKHSGEIVCDSFLASDSAVVDGERSKQEALLTYKSRSIYVSEGNSMRLVKTIDRIENRSVGTCAEELSHNPCRVAGCMSDRTSIQFPTCLYAVMTEGLSEALSPKHDICINSTGYNKHNLKSTEENAKDIAVCSSQKGVEHLGRVVGVEVGLQRKVQCNSEKVADVEFSKFCQDQGNILQMNDSSSQLKLAEIKAWSSDDVESGERLNNNPIQSQCVRKSMRPQTRQVGRRRPIACLLKDDDLLISAIIKKRSFKSSRNQFSDESGRFKLKPPKKRKSQNGSCRLLPRSLGKGSKHFKERWSLMGERTVLSWLVSAGAILINEPVEYRDPKDDSVVKDGQITSHGILCKCCNEVFSVSGFKIHAGFEQSRPCLNLFMGSGRPYTLCQLQAWSAEYKARRSSARSTPAYDFDKNDDSCGLCGDGGELLCCDNCPSTFHQSCLSAEDLPEGSWYCSNCTCRICGDLVDDKETIGCSMGVKCSHCEQKYHEVCLMEKTIVRVGGSPWFCGIACEEVYCGLQSRVGLCNSIADGYSWTLLKCIHDDQKIPSPQHFAQKAECNSKLAVAVTIMEECFLSMTDPRTGIDMIPQVVYNWGSEFARLDYHGFYTAVLEVDDVLISVACIRVHGVAVAEMPLIATCSKYRRQGMCHRLLAAIETMLISLKVKKLVIAAVPELVGTWTASFGFILMEDAEKISLRKINLMVFPGTVMLKKTLYISHHAAVPQGIDHLLPSENDESFEMVVCSEGEPYAGTIATQKSSEVAAPTESELSNTLDSSECKDKNTNIIGSASEIEPDDVIIAQIIEDQENSPHVAEDRRSVQAAKPTEVPSLQDNPCLKSKPVTADEPRSMDQYEPLSNLSPQVCLDEVVSLTSKRNVEVPFNVSNQAENVRTEVDVASELGSFMVGHPHEVKSITEPKEPNNNAIPKLVDSVAVEEDEGVARFMEKRDIFDQPQGPLTCVALD